MTSVRLEVRLNQLRQNQDRKARVAADPVSFVHRYPGPDDQEVVGLIAASLAFGNVTAIRASIDRVLVALGEAPAVAVRRRRRATLERRLEAFVHRIYRGEHVAALLANAGALVRDRGSLGAAFATELEAVGDFREALARFADALRGPDAPRGLRHLVPDPRAGSACKRLLLYLRWMVRPADGVDLGLWPISPAHLVIPVDTHVHRIARNLGFTQRKDASWRTAEEITACLRDFDPRDPVKYDFALCHLGISRQCPSQRDPDLCATCVLKAHCTHW